MSEEKEIEKVLAGEPESEQKAPEAEQKAEEVNKEPESVNKTAAEVNARPPLEEMTHEDSLWAMLSDSTSDMEVGALLDAAAQLLEKSGHL